MHVNFLTLSCNKTGYVVSMFEKDKNNMKFYYVNEEIQHVDRFHEINFVRDTSKNDKFN